ncbi:MAG: peptide ABC transporter ATP-binding protein [Halobacteriovorax sp.]|nr:peptide ABC transporter ATP-binding protein [Halobacteriovorax sp.]
MSVINVENLNKSYGKLKVIDDLSFSLESGKQIVIMGASGSGKSTFLYMLGGLEKCNSGKIFVGGKEITKLNDDALAKYRNREIGFVFQFHFLLPTLTCLENILMPARLGKLDTKVVKKYILSLAKRLDVDDCLSKYPYQISGGQQQRINLIRALSLKPKLLLCDEPTGNLDSKNSEIVTDLLLELSREFGTTLVVVTHDDDVAERFNHRMHMVDGILH